MDFLTIGLLFMSVLRFSNADGLTKKSGTIIIAGGGHSAPFPVPVPVPVPIHHGYQQQGYQQHQPYGQQHQSYGQQLQPYGQQHYDQHLPNYNTHHHYAPAPIPYSHHSGHYPNLVVLPIFAPKAHHEMYGFGDGFGHGQNIGQFHFQGYEFKA